MIDGQNLNFLKKNGAYYSQNNKALAVEKRIEEMNSNQDELIGADGLLMKKLDTRKVGNPDRGQKCA